MGYSLVISQSEQEVIQKLWAKPKKGDPRMNGVLFSFEPSTARKTVDKLQNSKHDEAIVNKIVARIVDIMGPSFLEQKANPVANEEEIIHKEKEETMSEETMLDLGEGMLDLGEGMLDLGEDTRA